MKLTHLLPTLLALGAATAAGERAHAQTKPPRPPAVGAGQEAPPLDVEGWLDDDQPVTLGDGTAAMLVFWAPWCGACVNEFAHLNELVEAATDLPVALVSITDEPEDQVRALLAKRPLRTRRALDRDGATFAAYGVRVLPRVVLVDAAGQIVGTPHASDVDAGVLTHLAQGEALGVEDARQQPADLEWDADADGFDARRSLAHVVIEASRATSGAMRFPPDSGRITADGVGFANLVQVAFGARPQQVDATHPQYRNFDQVYRASVKAPDDAPETARVMLREQLARLIPFEAEWVEVEESTPVLRRIEGVETTALRRSTASESSGMARHGSIEFVRVPFKNIARALGGFGLNRQLVDETGLEGRYDLELQWTPGDAASFRSALEACGLRISDEPRRVRKLRVTEPS